MGDAPRVELARTEVRRTRDPLFKEPLELWGEASGRKERAAKNSDLTCEDSKEALTKMVTTKHRRAAPEAMDDGVMQIWLVLVGGVRSKKGKKQIA